MFQFWSFVKSVFYLAIFKEYTTIPEYKRNQLYSLYWAEFKDSDSDSAH